MRLRDALRAVVRRVIRDDAGVSMVEYGLLVALVAVVVASSASVLGSGVGGLFRDVTTMVSGERDSGRPGGQGGQGGNSGSTNGWGNGSGGGQGHTN